MLSKYYYPPVHFWTLWFSETMLRFLNDNHRHLKRDDSVLDIGCGLGYHCNVISGMGVENVSGCDISKDAMALLNEFPTRVNFFKLDICSPDANNYKEKFSAIFSSDVYEHVDNPQLMLKNICSMLSPKGCVCITFPNWDNHGKNQFADKQIIIDQLKTAGFSKINVEIIEQYALHYRFFMFLYKIVQKVSDRIFGINRKKFRGSTMPESDEFHEMYAFKKIQKLKKHKLLCLIINLSYYILKLLLRIKKPYILSDNEDVVNKRIILYAEKS